MGQEAVEKGEGQNNQHNSEYIHGPAPEHDAKADHGQDLAERNLPGLIILLLPH